MTAVQATVGGEVTLDELPLREDLRSRSLNGLRPTEQASFRC
jgi:hypothetical protein